MEPTHGFERGTFPLQRMRSVETSQNAHLDTVSLLETCPQHPARNRTCLRPSRDQPSRHERTPDVCSFPHRSDAERSRTSSPAQESSWSAVARTSSRAGQVSCTSTRSGKGAPPDSRTGHYQPAQNLLYFDWTS